MSRPAAILRAHFPAILALVALAALLLRLTVGSELSGTAAVCHPLNVTDMATYRELALNFRRGILPAVFDYQPFYYTVLLPAAYCFSPSGGVWPVIVIQALLGAGAVYLSGLCAARLFGRAAGITAALLLALSRFHIFYTPYLLVEVTQSFWAALTLYLAMRSLQRPLRPLRIALLATALSCAVLTRGNALLWAFPGMALLLWRQHRAESWRRLLTAAAAGCLCFALPLLPYVIHNSRATGRLCGPSVAGGKVLALGNSPEAPAGGLEYPRTYHQWCEEEADGTRSVPANILRWAKKEPLLFADLTLRKLLLFWDRREIPNNVSFSPHADASRVLHWPFLIPWALLGALALAFLLQPGGWRQHSQRLMLVWMLLACWGATAAFYILARFRIAALPVLAVAGSGALSLAYRQWRRRRQLPRRCLVFAVLAWAVAFHAVNGAYDIYHANTAPALNRAFRPAGFAAQWHGVTAIYDHAPLLDGGQAPVPIPAPGGLHFSKTLIVPEKTLAGHTGAPAAMRLLLRVAVPAPTRLQATLTCNGQRIVSAPELVTERQCQWLSWEFTGTPQPQMRFDFHLRPYRSDAAVAVDLLRNYGRTTGLADYPDAEATVELEIRQ